MLQRSAAEADAETCVTTQQLHSQLTMLDAGKSFGGDKNVAAESVVENTFSGDILMSPLKVDNQWRLSVAAESSSEVTKAGVAAESRVSVATIVATDNIFDDDNFVAANACFSDD